MGFRELTMMEVREVLRRLGAGQALREVARATGLDRKTVRRYAEAAAASGFDASAAAPTEALVAEVAKRVQEQHVHLRQTQPVTEPCSDPRALAVEHRALVAWRLHGPALRRA